MGSRNVLRVVYKNFGIIDKEVPFRMHLHPVDKDIIGSEFFMCHISNLVARVMYIQLLDLSAKAQKAYQQQEVGYLQNKGQQL